MATRKQKSTRPQTLHLAFNTLEELIGFLHGLDLRGAALYEADALDDEMGGRAFPNAYVVRSVVTNDKAESQLVTLL